jgi:hypothetical protein
MKILASKRFNTAHDLIEALTELVNASPVNSEEIAIGCEGTTVRLVENTLTDGSKDYDIIIN